MRYPQEGLALSELHITGRGIYSFSRAAEIVGVPPQTLRQWTLGRRAPMGSVSAQPLVRLDVPELDGERVTAPFLNLVEVRLIGESLRRLKLPLQYIRHVIDVLEQSYDTTHPLACLRLQTDGRSIFAEIDESGEFACVEIAGRRPNHVVFDEVIRPLFREIDFAGSPKLARRAGTPSAAMPAWSSTRRSPSASPCSRPAAFRPGPWRGR